MRISICFFLCLVFLFACKERTTRKPIKVTSFTMELKLDSVLNYQKKDSIQLQNFINKDSLANFIKSKEGFWYTYETKTVKKETLQKDFDSLNIDYQLTDLENIILGNKAVNKNKMLKIGEANFFPIIHSQLKLMKIGETITFAIPSNYAYAELNDGKILNKKESIILKVTLINRK